MSLWAQDPIDEHAPGWRVLSLLAEFHGPRACEREVTLGASGPTEGDKSDPVPTETKEAVDGDGATRMVVVETANAELSSGLKGDKPEYRIPESVAKLGNGVSSGKVTVSEQDVKTQTA